MKKNHSLQTHRENKRIALKQLINDVYDLKNDMNIRVTKIGKIECTACKTEHPTESSYIIHRNGLRHQKLAKKRVEKMKILKFQPNFKIYRVKNEKEENGYVIKIKTEHKVYFRILSSFEQKVEQVDKNFNYLVLKVEKFDNIGIRIPVRKKYKIIKNFDGKLFTFQILF